MSRRFGIIVAIAVSSFLTTGAFQNCSRTTFGGASSTAGQQTSVRAPAENSGGGVGGYDGKPETFVHLGRCADGTTGVESEISHKNSGNEESYIVTRENCLTLNPPRAVATGEVRKAFTDPNVFVYQSKVFDKDGSGKRTLAYCRQDSAGADISIYHSNTLGAGLYGFAGLATGQSFGPQEMNPPEAFQGGVTYLSAAAPLMKLDLFNGQQGNFTLTISYRTVPFSGATCYIQEEPAGAFCPDVSTAEYTVDAAFDFYAKSLGAAGQPTDNAYYTYAVAGMIYGLELPFVLPAPISANVAPVADPNPQTAAGFIDGGRSHADEPPPQSVPTLGPVGSAVAVQDPTFPVQTYQARCNWRDVNDCYGRWKSISVSTCESIGATVYFTAPEDKFQLLTCHARYKPYTGLVCQ